MILLLLYWRFLLFIGLYGLGMYLWYRKIIQDEKKDLVEREQYITYFNSLTKKTVDKIDNV